MKVRTAPAEGRDWRPGFSGNHVSWDGAAVVKRHQPGGNGYSREYGILCELTDLPLPRVQAGSRPGELRMDYVDGLSASEAVENGRARDLLFAMGVFLRGLHRVDVRRVATLLPGGGEVIVHGDFGPHNVLLDRERPRLAAVLDWETASLGSRVLDLAWCESQFSQRFPRHVFAMGALFEGYGETPATELREEALRVRLAQLRDGSRGPEAPAAVRTILFPRVEEAAAYIAALSRFLNRPQGESHGRAEVELWRGPSGEEAVELFASEAAMSASRAGFGPFPGTPREIALPRDAVRVLRGDDVAPMGISEALALLGTNR